MLSLVAVALALDVDRPQLAGSSLSSAGTLGRPAPFLDGEGSCYVGTLVTLAEVPLRFSNGQPGVGQPVIDEVFGAEVGFGWVVAPRVRLDLALDTFPSVGFPAHAWSLDLDRLALGDARVGGLVAIVAPPRTGVGLAVDGAVRLATGSPFFTSGWGGQGRVIVGGRHPRLGWRVDLGATYAGDDPAFLGRSLGSAVVGGAGVHVWALEEVVLGAEIDARHPFAPEGDIGANASEWVAFVGYTPCSGAQLSIGGGGTVVPGIGTPEARFLLTFGYYQGDCAFLRTAPPEAIPPPPRHEPRTRPRPRPPPRAALTETAIVIDARIEFAYDSATLLPEATPVLEAVAKVLREHPEVTGVEVAGHTDERGGDAFNLALSQARAESVVAWLIQAGVAAERLSPRGYGETVPLAAGHSEASWATNRRVEFRVTTRAVEVH